MGDILVSGQKIQMPSTLFNFLVVINDTSSNLEVTSMHNNIGNPMIIIRNAVKKEDTEIEERLKNLEEQTAETEN